MRPFNSTYIFTLLTALSLTACQNAEFGVPEEFQGQLGQGVITSPENGNTGLTSAECSANRINNSGFESTDATVGSKNNRRLDALADNPGANKSWDHFSAIPGWSPSSGHAIEVQANRTAQAFEGVHYIEIDSESEAQSNFVSCSGQHLLQFAYYARNRNGSANTIEVYVDGNLVQLVGGNTSASFWNVVSINLNLSAGNHTIKFAAHSNAGGSTVGALVDAVSLRKSQAPGVLTALLSFSSTFEGEAQASEERLGSIISEMVDYTSPVQQPNILLIEDDAHFNEALADFDIIEGALGELGTLTVLDLSEEGYDKSELQKYDLVWYVNPGFPASRTDVLADLESFNGGVVLSGDDLGRASQTTGISKSKYISNGVRACSGAPTINNNKGSSYTLEGELLAGLSNGDDIDHVSIVGSNVEILGEASFEHEACDGRLVIPVVYGYRKS